MTTLWLHAKAIDPVYYAAAGAIISVLILLIVVRRALKPDKGFDPHIPWNRCEAGMWVHGGAMRVICGRKTNLKTNGYWHCVEHTDAALNAPKKPEDK